MNDESEILRIHRQWIELEESGRGGEVLSLCDRDVVWLVPGMGMLTGIDEIGTFLNSRAGAKIVRIITYDIDVELADRLAVKRAKFRTTLMEGSSRIQVQGAHIWTLRKTGSDQWRVASVAWSIEEDCP